MVMSGGNWKWPVQDDICWYPHNDVIEGIKPPKNLKD